ncbi:DUF1878 family protein [Oceanobacillus chungangensis]|uniref:DUF1878 domain-containing protein n=1 Tax=Oceanobacillus chungangensis TaxID=1229152 RepID=A0A3D8PUQ2_9BACI|nr:DUF1878 family protein [Oceanobacillus chungangensis]RDW19890.1 hypothetical protein CWR45_07455 [Oceanobacillus chungangensis]
MKEIKINDSSSFHIHLLSKVIDMDHYPFTKLIIENHITFEEYEELMGLLHKLNDTFEEQKEEGLMDFTLLLIHFAGMLNEKLNPNHTIYGLKKEGYFPSLMDTFIDIINRNESKYKRR